MTNSGRRRSTAIDRPLGGLLLACLSLAAVASACAHHDATPVARGEYYAAGKPDYDEFFVKLYRHQLDTASALKLEQAARDELARATGAAPNAKASELGPNLQKLAGELEQAGVEVTVPARAGDAPPELVVRGEPKGDQVAQVEALRAAARKLFGLERLAREGGAELDALRTRSIELDRDVDRVFWTDGAGKRTEVKNNLSDARELIALMSDNRKVVQQSSSELLSALRQNFEPKAPPPAAETEESEGAAAEEKKKNKRGSGKRASAVKKGNPKAKPGRRPAAARPPAEAAAPAPKPAPAPKAEFEP